MKTFKLISVLVILGLLIVFACTYDREELSVEEVGEFFKEKMAIGEKPDGSIIYYEEAKQKYQDLYPDAVWVDVTLERNNGKGKGKSPKVVQLAPNPEPQLATQAITNIMYDPVKIPDSYTTPLPEPIEGNEALVDWDGDGVLDTFTVHNRCYFPKSFSYVTVNGVMINNSIAFGAQLLGFDDVDNDGDLDALFYGGNNRRFNAYDGVNNGPQAGEVTEPVSAYNVGYNDVGETPLSFAEMIDNLVVTVSSNNPDFVRWTFGQFLFENELGDVVSQYDAFPFHVYWRAIDPVTEEFLPGEPGYQTITYGEWGIGASHLPTGAGGAVKIRFTNADRFSDPNDECVDVWKTVIF